MLARCASTVFTLIFSRCPISLFLNPAQINSRISCSRLVNDSGRFFRGGGVRSASEARDVALADRAMFFGSTFVGGVLRYTAAMGHPRLCTSGVPLRNYRKSSKSCKPMHNGPSVYTYAIVPHT